ncbi:malate synthase A [Sporolactobacillus putidus]|uniref:Malate synthase n=1 Tax=Sporolactobacillus putidus TaxID=492735 RepID=A0A917W231_9BACL|nr:malate synthase A [Sporolactobacillus putidus]GGL60157.1 malate synthase [Sporolactobacillus putidus]
MATQTTGIKVTGPMRPEYDTILTQEALRFIDRLERTFGQRRIELLNKRNARQKDFDRGERPDFLEETRKIREGNWQIAPLPKDLLDRRVEITGPASDRKMVINALNSGAKFFMADLEDAMSPSWDNVIQAQINLRDAIRKTISFVNEKGKRYQLKDNCSGLMARPRGWHMIEKNVRINEVPVSGSLLDFGLFFFHNVRQLIENGTAPYYYLPKLESHLEARLWNDVFAYSEQYAGIPNGTIKATVLLETIPAAFEMDEILYELRDHSAGLNCGRWDYIFSYIKKFRNQKDIILPDRSEVTMTVPFMRAYALLAIKTCHRRKAPAIGGMAAQIPVKGNDKLNEEAFAKVEADKQREANDGHDGTWVAHPGLVPVALKIFDRDMPEPNQIEKKSLEDIRITAEQLLAVPVGHITESGVRENISVGIQYIASWLRGNGAAPINHLMEDAATAEISRAQMWQWIRHPKGVLEDGRKVTVELYKQIRAEEMQKLKQQFGETGFVSGKFEEAAGLFDELTLSDDFADFLTLPGYARL